MKKKRVAKKKPTPPASGETRSPDFHWKGRPVFRCTREGCRYERVENLEAVLRHEQDHQLTPSQGDKAHE